MPSISVTQANSTAGFQGNYTLAMVDAGPVCFYCSVGFGVTEIPYNKVGTDESLGQTRHMLINGVTVDGTHVFKEVYL